MHKKILYLDCPMGISGDMCLAALIDAGADLGFVKAEVEKLPIEGYTLEVERGARSGISGMSFKVNLSLSEAHPHRSYKDIKEMLEGSGLKPGVSERSLVIFSVLAVAEADVHGVTPEEVRFHEIGAVDSIVDIVGAAAAVESLGVEEIFSSPIPAGSGWVDTEHGRMPVPAPATLKLVKGLKTAKALVEGELTTPTGAAIVSALVDAEGGEAATMGPMPEMRVTSVGTGLGTKEFIGVPNILRAVLGVSESKEAGEGRENIVVMETNIDDMTPELSGYLLERLLGAGALDAFFTPAQMKKSRPGVLLTVLAKDGEESGLLEVIFSESTTIGVRCRREWRESIPREERSVDTRFGPVRVKISSRNGSVENVKPEYEDVRRLALERGVPFKELFDEVRRIAREEAETEGEAEKRSKNS